MLRVSRLLSQTKIADSQRDTAPKAPAVPEHKTPACGHRSPDHDGMVYGAPSKSGPDRISKVVTRFVQDLQVCEDQSGESLILRPKPQGQNPPSMVSEQPQTA